MVGSPVRGKTTLAAGVPVAPAYVGGGVVAEVVATAVPGVAAAGVAPGVVAAAGRVLLVPGSGVDGLVVRVFVFVFVVVRVVVFELPLELLELLELPELVMVSVPVLKVTW